MIDNLTFLTGCSGEGLTSYALQLAFEAAAKNEQVLFLNGSDTNEAIRKLCYKIKGRISDLEIKKNVAFVDKQTCIDMNWNFDNLYPLLGSHFDFIIIDPMFHFFPDRPDSLNKIYLLCKTAPRLMIVTSLNTLQEYKYIPKIYNEISIPSEYIRPGFEE